MRMVSKKFSGKRLAILSLGLIGVTALAVSPHFAAINSKLKGLQNANVDCSQYANDQQKKQECDKCKQGVDEQKGSVPGKVAGAQAKDGAIESTAVASSKASTGGAGSAKATMNSDQGNKAGGSGAKKDQATNFADLAKKLNECKDKVDQACQGEMASKGKDAKDACEQAAQEAQKASAESGAQGDQMAKDEKKDDGNGKGMEMPKMPEMPKAPEKTPESSISSNTATNTATKVADSTLSGNQLAQNKVGIGGTDDKKAAAQSTSMPSFHSPGGFDSGISNNKGFDIGGGTGGSKSSTGSSSMGAGGGLGSGGGDSGGGSGSAAAAAAPVPPKEPEIEAFANGGSRPSYLGIKSKGGELADLGLEAGAAAAALDANKAGEADRTLASTDKNEGIHTEDNAGTLFNMVHERLLERGRSGGI